MGNKGKRGCLGRLIGGVVSLLLLTGILVLVLVAAVVVEGEVRTRQALEHLTLTVQGPDEGTRAQQRDGYEVNVGVAQMESVPLDTEANLARIGENLRVAGEQGCELLVLPELAVTGMTLDEGIWEAAEPLSGEIVQRLKALAAEHAIDLATSVVEEADGEIYNTAVYISSQGTVLSGRKLHPPMAESARFARGEGPQVVGTMFGRVGLVLCADAFRAETYDNLAEADPDLVLIMAAAPHPDLQLPGMRAYTPEEWAALAAYYSDRLGVPVASAQACGSTVLEIPWMGKSVGCTFTGSSRIVSRRTRVNSATPVGVEMVTATKVFVGRLGPQLNANVYGDYLVPRSMLFNALTSWSEDQGAAFYAANKP
jgi:predicted amidohydrolase